MRRQTEEGTADMADEVKANMLNVLVTKVAAGAGAVVQEGDLIAVVE